MPILIGLLSFVFSIVPLVATYYRSLVDTKIPKNIAKELTVNYQTVMLMNAKSGNG